MLYGSNKFDNKTLTSYNLLWLRIAELFFGNERNDFI